MGGERRLDRMSSSQRELPLRVGLEECFWFLVVGLLGLGGRLVKSFSILLCLLCGVDGFDDLAAGFGGVDEAVVAPEEFAFGIEEDGVGDGAGPGFVEEIGEGVEVAGVVKVS